MAYHRYHKVDTRIVRIFNTYGPRLQLNDGRVISNFMKQALRGEPLTVYGDGNQTRSFCYVSDQIDGIPPPVTNRRALAGQHRQPRRVHHPGMRRARSQSHRLEEQNRVRAPAARRPQTAPSRHHQSPHPARLGTKDSTGRRPAPVAGLFQEGCSRRSDSSEVTTPQYNWAGSLPQLRLLGKRVRPRDAGGLALGERQARRAEAR